tara:strand:- start:634 stop:1800 length:1167 start_codon:yes stop_codon:yes gene_type:complete
MSVQYRSIFPLAQKENYTQNDAIDFTLTYEDEALVPGTVAFTGKCTVYSTGTTQVLGTDRLYIDPLVGYHAVFKSLTTEFRNTGIVENFDNYPRFVKMQTDCGLYNDSLGTETDNGMEGRTPNAHVANGYLQGLEAGVGTEAYFPFCVKPLNVLNKMDGNLGSNKVGSVRLRIRLAPNGEVLWGQSCTTNSNYVITDLKLHYQTVPLKQAAEKVNLELYHSARQKISSNNSNISSFVPGLSNAVHISFINQSDEATVTKNYLETQPLPGKPSGGVGPPDSDTTSQAYGIEKLYYSVNDTDSALCSFTLSSRAEILWNYLRSFNLEPRAYAARLWRLNAPGHNDGYGAGIAFGGLLDFTSTKFATEVQSQVTSADPFSAYLFFRMTAQV